MTRYYLKWAPTHLLEADALAPDDSRYIDGALALTLDFAFLEKRLKYGTLKQVLNEYIRPNRQIRTNTDAEQRVLYDAYVDVIRSNAHYLRRDSDENPAYKIMLQRAMEIADECPVTQAAERWLSPTDGESPCDWFWLREIAREKEYYPNPCKMVVENAGNQALVLKNGAVLSWGTGDNALHIWNPETGERVGEPLRGHEDMVKGAIQLASGDVLSWDNDKPLRIWNAVDGKQKIICKGRQDKVGGVIQLVSGDVLAWSRDKTLRVWNPDDGKLKVVYKGHNDDIDGAIQLASGDVLSLCKDKSLRVWNYVAGNSKVICKGNERWLNGAIQLTSGDVLSWSSDGVLQVWNPVNGEQKAICEGHEGWIDGAIQLASGDVLSWGIDNTLRVWNPADGTQKAVCKGHEDYIRGAVQLTSGNIISNSWGCFMRKWTSAGDSLGVVEQDDSERIEAYQAFSQESVPTYNRFVLSASNGGKLYFDQTILSIWNGFGNKTLIGHNGVCIYHRGETLHFLRLYYGAEPFPTLDDAIPKILAERKC